MKLHHNLILEILNVVDLHLKDLSDQTITDVDFDEIRNIRVELINLRIRLDERLIWIRTRKS